MIMLIRWCSCRSILALCKMFGKTWWFPVGNLGCRSLGLHGVPHIGTLTVGIWDQKICGEQDHKQEDAYSCIEKLYRHIAGYVKSAKSPKTIMACSKSLGVFVIRFQPLKLFQLGLHFERQGMFALKEPRPLFDASAAQNWKVQTGMWRRLQPHGTRICR